MMIFAISLFWGHPAPQTWIIGSLVLAVVFTLSLAYLLTRNFEPDQEVKRPNSQDYS